MKKQKNVIKIKPTGDYPCRWDDLIDTKRNVIATIYTVKEAIKDNLKIGITKGKNGIYDIVMDSEEINNEIVKNALKLLSKKTGKQYALGVKPSAEDKILTYSEKLMKPFEKYGNIKKGYDFSKAKTPKQKAEIIGGWMGEILYEALTYKDVNIVKSLTGIIKIEIEELIKDTL